MDLRLDGKLALVTGATRGIGAAIARALAAEGVKVVGAARTEVEVPYPLVLADVSTPEGATAAIDGAVAKLGGLDIVVANVGKSFGRRAQQMDDEDFGKSLDANLWSAMLVAQRAVPHLINRKGGAITMISSLFGKEAGGAPGYNVAKAGVIALAKALARDYAKDAIRVNAVAPGSILFPGGGWDKRQKSEPEAIAAFVEREIPMGRFGTVEEVADVVTFLCSPRASWITGTTIAVDGGQSRSF